MSIEYPWFTCYQGCDCTDIEPIRDELPTRCPCHGGRSLGADRITAGTFSLGHRCTLWPAPATTTAPSAATPEETP